MTIKHHASVTHSNNPAYDVSATAWTADHDISGGALLSSQWSADSHGNVTADSDSATGTPLTVVGSTSATALVVTTPLGSRIEIGDTLLADSDAADGGMAIESTQPANDGEYIWKILVNGVKIFNQDSDGPVTIRATRVNATLLDVKGSDASSRFTVHDDGRIVLGPVLDTTRTTVQVLQQTGQTGDLWQAFLSSDSSVPFRIGPNGELIVALHAAPADAILAAGEMAIWFDQTNGAAKLMVKAKQADGTVRTGSVNLS